MVEVVDLGRTAYRSCWELQRRLRAARVAGETGDTLLLTEHDPVYTLGAGGSDAHLLAGAEECVRLGVEVVATDRGGDITYHGPGQLVAYPIFDLTGHGRDLHRYLRALEESVIQTLASFGITGTRVDGLTGVWVAGEKICAIGVKTSQWVSTHGLALNVCTDLAFFGRIIPCGIFDRGVTTMQHALGRPLGRDEVLEPFVEAFARVFGVSVIRREKATFLSTMETRHDTER
jgi:lipoyl(octanoyl) transferase